MEENIITEAWNTILYEKFCRFKHLLVAGLSKHGEAAMADCDYRAGNRILDVGCGFGDTAIEIARQVGPNGEVVGVDCASHFIRDAKASACDSAIGNARFMVADVQQDDLGGPYDHAFSRFGTMFFELPGLAMRNVRRSLEPGGEFTQVVWRRREENLWAHEAEQRVKEIVPVVSHEETDAVHCGPGPFSMAGADMVSAMLQSAGFNRVNFERHDCDICIGRDLDEAVEFAMAVGPAGEIIRLAGDEGEARKAEVTEALQDVLKAYQRADGVWAPSSTWIVRATNPG